MNYQLSSFLGNTHIFQTDEVNGISYKYLVNPEARSVIYMNYLEIEKLIDGKLAESVVVSRKQIIFHDIKRDYQWQYIFKSGNKYSYKRHYTKNGALWLIQSKIEKGVEIVNLEYDVNSELIEQCIKLTNNEQKN